MSLTVIASRWSECTAVCQDNVSRQGTVVRVSAWSALVITIDWLLFQ